MEVQEALDSLKLELTGSYELHHMGARNQTWVLYKSSTHAKLLNQISRDGDVVQC